jgi:hypothetical protein
MAGYRHGGNTMNCRETMGTLSSSCSCGIPGPGNVPSGVRGGRAEYRLILHKAR